MKLSYTLEQQQQVPNSINNNNTHSDKGKQVVGSDTTHKQNDKIIPPPQHNFPRVSNNFGRYVPRTHGGNNMLPQDPSHNVQTVANSQNNAKKDLGDANLVKKAKTPLMKFLLNQPLIPLCNPLLLVYDKIKPKMTPRLYWIPLLTLPSRGCRL
ncbi:hypothetical protein H5410_050573 [Solanum commersonii]|uniref:Uncharacterized protein n=1 Tax=Solanum commersonii TaxID=4109 RepID=A0A9J5WVX6_SOLCO|nr:hypothetical protein H5410_050573 [Solanum commersonii]